MIYNNFSKTSLTYNYFHSYFFKYISIIHDVTAFGHYTSSEFLLVYVMERAVHYEKKNSRLQRESERLFDWSEVTQTRPLCALGPREHDSRVSRRKTGRDCDISLHNNIQTAIKINHNHLYLSVRGKFSVTVRLRCLYYLIVI